MTEKIKIAVGGAYGPISCHVCDACIDHHSHFIILAMNEEAGVAVCGSCIKGGVEKIDQRLRERAAAERETLLANIEAYRKNLTEHVAWLESLVGRLQVPGYEEYLVAMKRETAKWWPPEEDDEDEIVPHIVDSEHRH